MPITPTTSQGYTFGGIAGLTNVKIAKKGGAGPGTSNKLDATTLATEADSDGKTYRVYVDGLPDPGAGADESGIVTTVTVSYTSDDPPTAGMEVEHDGQTLVCTQADVEYAVGELVKGSATFTTKPSGS